MRARRRSVSVMKMVTIMCVLLLGCIVISEAAYVVTKQGKRIEGTEIRAKATGEIILQTTQGQRNFSKGQYSRAVADNPPQFDRAKQLINERKFDAAVPILESIVKKYRFLEWDNQARVLLPQVYLGKGDFGAAVKAFEELFRVSPKSKEKEDLLWGYRDTLIKAGKVAQLEPVLDKVIQGGSRADAARAQIMRGDIRRSQGQLESAALDYLRTVILFEKEKSSQPEALFKAASALEELRDRRYKELYKRLANDYPNSPYASEARAKL